MVVCIVSKIESITDLVIHRSFAITGSPSAVPLLRRGSESTRTWSTRLTMLPLPTSPLTPLDLPSRVSERFLLHLPTSLRPLPHFVESELVHFHSVRSPVPELERPVLFWRDGCRGAGRGKRVVRARRQIASTRCIRRHIPFARITERVG